MHIARGTLCAAPFLFLLALAASPASAIEPDKTAGKGAAASPRQTRVPAPRPKVEDFNVPKWDSSRAENWDTEVLPGLRRISCAGMPQLRQLLKTLLPNEDCETSRGGISTFVDSQGKGAPKTTTGNAVPKDVLEYLQARIRGELADWLLTETLDAICGGAGLDYFPDLCTLQGEQLYTLQGVNGQVQVKLRHDLQEMPAYVVWRQDQHATWGYVLTNAVRQMREQDPKLILAGLWEQRALVDSCNGGTAPDCTLWTMGLLFRAYLPEQGNADPRALWTRIAGRAIYLHWASGRGDGAQQRIEWMAARLNRLLDAGNAAQASENARRLLQYGQRVEDEYQALKSALQKAAADKTEAAKKAVERARADLLQDVAAYVYAVGQALSYYKADEKPALYGYEDFFGRLYLGYKYVQVVGALESSHGVDRLRAVSELLTCLGTTRSTPGLREDDPLCPGDLPIKLDDDARALIKAVGKDLLFVADLAERLVEESKNPNEPVKDLGDRWGDVGLYKSKRRYRRDSIGMLAGVGAGYERTAGGGVNAYSGGTLGVAAPVGFDLVTPVENLGLFVSVLDLGNLLTARVSGDSNSQVSSTETNAGFSELQSYGVYARWWLGKSPFVLFFGASYAPNLRQANLTSGGSQNVNSTRITGGVALELPFLVY
jgi:hypothetical protein